MYGAFSTNYKRDKENSYIASRGTAHGHAAENAQEFFAEGYNVFHGHDAAEWARLRRVAPQLYAYLHQQATTEGTLPSGIPEP